MVEENSRGMSSEEVKNEQGWRNKETTLQAVFDWFVTVKHRKLLAKRWSEREGQENNGSHGLLA